MFLGDFLRPPEWQYQPFFVLKKLKLQYFKNIFWHLSTIIGYKAFKNDLFEKPLSKIEI